jgi:uncharacterized protein (DUF2147 family)
MHRLIIAVLAGLFAASFAAHAQQARPEQILGRWLSENKRGVIDIYPCNGDQLCGKLVWLIEPLKDGRPILDDKNPDPALRARPRCNLVIMGGFKHSEPLRWTDGWIYDPDSGKTYHAQMFLEKPDLLQLRGYVGIPLFGETNTWTRADPNKGSC